MTENDWNNVLAQRHGADMQQKFSAAAVAVCGLGGLGSNAAIALARAGVGTLLLIDHDRVELSNLHRQQYAPSQIGMCKTDAMRQTLAQIAPFCHVITHAVRLTEDNLSLLRGCDIICECFDDAACKAMLVSGAAAHFPDAYIVAASGMSGLHSGNLIHTRRIGKQLYLCGDGMSDIEEDGTLFAPRVMLCAAHQANTVLRILAENYEV